MNDDLISRQATINALDSINCFGWVEDSWKNVCSIIEHVPAAQPERKRGKWISRKNESKHNDWWTCSECQGRFDYGWKFCPNCGADMRGGKDERAMG